MGLGCNHEGDGGLDSNHEKYNVGHVTRWKM